MVFGATFGGKFDAPFGGSAAVTPSAKFYCTTTGAATLTIAAMTVITGKTVTVDWGDGSNNVYTAGSGARTHNYAGAGTWTVKITPATDISALTLSDNKITLNSADIKLAVNITSLNAHSLKAGKFDSSDVSAWRLETFYLYGMPSGYTGTFNSTDVSAWRPTTFALCSMPSGYAGTFNSSDVSAWRPTTFYLYSMSAGYAGTFNSSDISDWRPGTIDLHGMPSGYAGTFNSSDVSAWRPTAFQLYGMPSGYAGTFSSSDVSDWRPTTFLLQSMPTGYAGTFNSADISDWRPLYFYLNSMPTGYAGTFDSSDVSAWRPTEFRLYSMKAGYAGTFDSADVSDWRPATFLMYSMPAGYAGTFDSADISAWRPTYFHLYSMPVATFTITISDGGFDGWVSTTGFNMYGNSLTQTQVDQILSDFWTGFASRTGTAGTLNVGGSNSAPSGTYQAANPPTTGKEFAYELKNDSQEINPTKKWATVTITA